MPLRRLAVAYELGVPPEKLREALAGFGGVKRRFTRTGEWNGALIFDDYGHHPVEIAAVLKAARASTTGKVIAIVQPHRYTRLHSACSTTSATCFNDADAVFVADPSMPPARQPIEGAGRDDSLVAGHEGTRSPQCSRRWRGRRTASPCRVLSQAWPVLVIMSCCLGAGDITQWAYALPGELKALAAG